MRRVLLLLMAMAVAVACGVPMDERAQPIDTVPFGLLDEEAPEPIETEGPAEGPVVQIYLLDSATAQLVAVERRLSDAGVPMVLASLMSGPTAAERQQGLSTAFADQAAVSRVELVGGVASVDLTTQFTLLEGPIQRVGIAQMVLTLTSRPGVGRVAFTLEGQPIDIPRGDGTLATGSVSRDNYREFLPAG